MRQGGAEEVAGNSMASLWSGTRWRGGAICSVPDREGVRRGAPAGRAEGVTARHWARRSSWTKACVHPQRGGDQ
eukprot:2725308-Pyramimonas_sp.AAC.1